MSTGIEDILTVAGLVAMVIVVMLIGSWLVSVCGIVDAISRHVQTRDVLDLEAQSHLAHQNGDIARLDQLEAQLRDLKQGSK